jgi:hypothetical protein
LPPVNSTRSASSGAIRRPQEMNITVLSGGNLGGVGLRVDSCHSFPRIAVQATGCML